MVKKTAANTSHSWLLSFYPFIQVWLCIPLFLLLFQKEQSSMWTAWSMVSSSITGFTIFSCVFHCFRRSRVSCGLPEVRSPQVLLVSPYFPVFFIVSEGAELHVNCLKYGLLKYYWFHHIFLCFSLFQKEQSSMWTAWSMVSSSITGFTIFSCVFHRFRRSRAPCELPEIWSPQVLLVSPYFPVFFIVFRRSRAPCELPEVWSPQVLLVSPYFPVFFIVSEGAELHVNCLKYGLLKYYWFHYIFLCVSSFQKKQSFV